MMLPLTVPKVVNLLKPEVVMAPASTLVALVPVPAVTSAKLPLA